MTKKNKKKGEIIVPQEEIINKTEAIWIKNKKDITNIDKK